MIHNKSVMAINTSVFLLMTGVGLVVALLPQRMMSLGASVSDVGFLAGVYAVPNVLLQIPVGRLADRFGFKNFIVGGYLLCGLSGMLFYLAASPSCLLLGRFLHGLAEVPIWALGPVLLSVSHPGRKGRYMGMYNASLHLGLTSGGLLTVVFSGFCRGNEPFLLFAALSLLGGLIIGFFVDDRVDTDSTHRPERRAVGYSGLTADRNILIVLFGAGLYGAGYGVFITLVPACLINTQESIPVLAGIFFTCYYASLSLSQLMAGGWSDGSGRKPVMVTGLALAALGSTAFSWTDVRLEVVLLTLAGLGLGMFCVASMAYLNDRVGPAFKGAVSGAFYFFWGMGYLAGPMALGRVGNRLGFITAFALFAGVLGVQLITVIIFVGEEAPERRDADA